MSAQEPITLTASGETKTLYQWAKETETPYPTLWARFVRDGWSAEDAISGTGQGERPAYTEIAKEKELKMKQARILFRKGISSRKAAKRLGRSEVTVRGWWREMGLSAQARRREWIRKRRQKVWHLYQCEGMSGEKIRHALNIGEYTVYSDLKAVQDDPSILMVDKAGYCDCGRESTICVKVKVRQGAKEVMELCPSCYELFLEIENK